jgi:hypothetical protein
MTSGNGRDPVAPSEQGDAEAQGASAQMFQGIQGGRPVAERAGHQDRRRRGGRRGEPTVVPEADFRSYYGRPVLKPPVWKHEIPAYLFTGGLAAGTAVVAAGADLTGRPALRRASWLGSFGGLLASVYFLVVDLGRPARFHHMLRVIKPTSPMSVGTWIISAFGPGCAAAALNELVPPPLAAHVAGPAAGQARPPARALGRGDRARRRLLHRGPALAHGRPGLERGARRAALRLRRFGRGQRWRVRHALRPRRRERPGARVRRGGRGPGAGGLTGDGAPDGPGRRGVRGAPRRPVRPRPRSG